MKFKKLLIANRGEIAVRVIRACRALGISPVAVYCDGEENALHVRLADEAHCLGKSIAGFLHAMRLVKIAKDCGAQAIHPGYGFISEQVRFALACSTNGIIFIGPSANTLRLAGHKTNARACMSKAGVPVIPGSVILSKATDLSKAAGKVGFPIMLKSAFGGGGKGMKVAHTMRELSECFSLAQQEARSSFGKDGMFLERYLEGAQHIEVQILCDHHGNVVHLGERNCSLQRRHQKLLEESPSPGLAPVTRKKLFEYALTAARVFRYHNAGTVEFLVDSKDNIYFLEVNARIQVEHPVTEMLTGIDLVEQQIRLAAGEPLPFAQDNIKFRGHAIECRIYAEDPFEQFLPSTGKIDYLALPGGPGIRVDTALELDTEVTPNYDSLIAKIIVHGENRAQAITRMRCALNEFHISPVHTTAPLFHRILQDKAFVSGSLTTQSLPQIQKSMHEASPKIKSLALLVRNMLKNADDVPSVTHAPETLIDTPPPLPSHGALLNAWQEQ